MPKGASRVQIPLSPLSARGPVRTAGLRAPPARPSRGCARSGLRASARGPDATSARGAPRSRRRAGRAPCRPARRACTSGPTAATMPVRHCAASFTGTIRPDAVSVSSSGSTTMKSSSGSSVAFFVGCPSSTRSTILAEVQVGSHEVAVTNPDKVFFPAGGLTKGDLVALLRRRRRARAPPPAPPAVPHEALPERGRRRVLPPEARPGEASRTTSTRCSCSSRAATRRCSRSRQRGRRSPGSRTSAASSCTRGTRACRRSSGPTTC